MTPQDRASRDAAICDHYLEGHSVSECAIKFALGEQRVRQILQTNNVWVPSATGTGERTKFLGVNVSKETKDALQATAKKLGMSVSKLTSDVLDEIVK